MEQRPLAPPRDPVLGALLSLVLPGLGFGYAGHFFNSVVVLAIEMALLSYRDKPPALAALAAVHLFQCVAAAGAVRGWNARHAAAGSAVLDIPPPPPPGSRPAPHA